MGPAGETVPASGCSWFALPPVNASRPGPARPGRQLEPLFSEGLPGPLPLLPVVVRYRPPVPLHSCVVWQMLPWESVVFSPG